MDEEVLWLEDDAGWRGIEVEEKSKCNSGDGFFSNLFYFFFSELFECVLFDHCKYHIVHSRNGYDRFIGNIW